jgi:hypothetical protein
MHHRGYVKYGAPTLWTHAHVWFGRIIMILAIVNGGIGIQYAENAVAGEKGYGVVTGVFGLAYIGVLVWVWLTKGKEVGRRGSDESVVVGAFGEKELVATVKEV